MDAAAVIIAIWVLILAGVRPRVIAIVFLGLALLGVASLILAFLLLLFAYVME